MTIDIGIVIATGIALLTSLIVMMQALAENSKLQKEIRRLKIVLRTERGR